MSKKQKLELTWIGKENRPRLEPRILLEDAEKSYHARHRVTENDIFDNRLIFGDNLLALKALEQEFAGKVKCVFIDPPDFAAETEDGIYMLEPKARNQMDDPIVLTKKEAAVKWYKQASGHAKGHGGKPWKYVLIPHDAIAENMSLGVWGDNSGNRNSNHPNRTHHHG